MDLQYLINRYLCVEIFSVKDPPDILDPNLYDFAMFLSVHLGSVADFLKFGEKLVGDKILYVQTIGKDVNKPLVNKCLELIELWIKSVESPKWQNLVEAAEESGFGGLATALIAEFGSQEVEPPKESVKRVENRGNYKYTVNREIFDGNTVVLVLVVEGYFFLSLTH